MKGHGLTSIIRCVSPISLINYVHNAVQSLIMWAHIDYSLASPASPRHHWWESQSLHCAREWIILLWANNRWWWYLILEHAPAHIAAKCLHSLV
jgi:hypothetical protein